MFNCPYCGKPLPDDSVFCESCGNAVSKFGTPQSSGQPAVAPKKKGKGRKIIVACVLGFTIITATVTGIESYQDSFLGSDKTAQWASGVTSGSSNSSSSKSTSSSDVDPTKLIGVWGGDTKNGYINYVFFDKYCIVQSKTSVETQAISTTWALSGTSLKLNVSKETADAIGWDDTLYAEFTYKDGSLVFLDESGSTTPTPKISDESTVVNPFRQYLNNHTLDSHKISVAPSGAWEYYGNSNSSQATAKGVWLFYEGNAVPYKYEDGKTTTVDMSNGALILFGKRNGVITPINIVQAKSDGSFESIIPSR